MISFISIMCCTSFFFSIPSLGYTFTHAILPDAEQKNYGGQSKSRVKARLGFTFVTGLINITEASLANKFQETQSGKTDLPFLYSFQVFFRQPVILSASQSDLR